DAEAAGQDDVEAISFSSTPVLQESAPPEPGPEPTQQEAAEAIEFDLGNLTFDDSMLPEAEDEDEGEAQYQPRTGQDECDTKLDLATAYEAMGDVADAIEILDEVIAEGNPSQVETAKRLKQSWQSAS